MKKLFLLTFITFSLIACKTDKTKTTIDTVNKTVKQDSIKVTKVAEFTGQQVTGVTVSDSGRVFVNFPRWRPTVNHAVTEVIGQQ